MADKAREQAPERLEVVEGDITDRRLELSDERYEQLAAEVTQVYHLAAIYDLAVPIEAAQAVNVDGTGNILDFCLACDSLERLHYVSTAYVAGHAHGRGLRARADAGPAVQEPLRVDQVPGGGVGAPADGPHPHDDLPPRHRGRRLAHRRDGQVRRALLHAARDLAVGPAQAADPALRPRGSDVQRGAGRLRDRGDARRRAAPGTLCTWSTPSRSRPTRSSTRWPRPTTARRARIACRPRRSRRRCTCRPCASSSPGRPPSRSSTSTTRFASTPAARSRCSGPRGSRCPHLKDYVEPMVRFFREHEDDPAYAPGGGLRG